MNCLGISFFLASALAFNKKNRFIVLDDVISSFDSTHRKRFADLLNEKLVDYQLIVLTHEKTWFEYVAGLVKGKNWRLATVKWTESDGTHLDEPPEGLRQRIERRISSGDVEDLGNEIKKYLEHRLKELAVNLEVKVKFRFNDSNEERMCHELLSDLKGSVNKHGSDDIKVNPIFDRLLGSLFIANKDSHDSSVGLKIGDFKAFWSDVLELESLFYCDSVSCGDHCVSLKRYDLVGKQAMCRCGKKSQSWKK